MLDNVYIKINVNGQTFKGSGPSYSVAISSPARQSIAIRPASAINLKFATRPSPSFGSLVGDPTDNEDLVEYITEQISAGREKRVVTIATSTTPTPNCVTTDHFVITDLASAAVFGAPLNPTDGKMLLYAVRDNGIARALTLDAIFVDVFGLWTGTTVANKWLYFGVRYNAVVEKFHLISVGQEQ